MEASSIYDFTVLDANQNPYPLFRLHKPFTINNKERECECKGKVVTVIVNVSSEWGLTNKNYAELHELYRKYGPNSSEPTNGRFEILAFPCNQFGRQEPASPAQIAANMHAKFGVTFPIMDKINVNGAEEAPLFTFLKSKQGGYLSSLLGSGISWNFTKFLCVDGIPIARYSPAVSPSSMEKKIQTLLMEPSDKKHSSAASPSSKEKKIDTLMKEEVNENEMVKNE